MKRLVTLIFNSFNLFHLTKTIVLVYSRDIKWLPIGRQLEVFPRGDEQVGVIHKDILLNKLNPGHEIDIIMEAVKGIGKDHAKFSPVCMFRSSKYYI